MPERKFDEYDTKADHCWFELSTEGFEYTDQPANVSLTAQQLAENFAACRDNWQDAEYAALDEDSQGFGMELHGLCQKTMNLKDTTSPLTGTWR